ncbi:FlgO family outer membrane protein [Celerinatantimonas yamalensis]|uniref:FlgO family outer membrane protein n=1 Tax=Celerinatantimonas yamalensis TaxID=559956 RepID=A0ABW9G6G7_9GAMM
MKAIVVGVIVAVSLTGCAQSGPTNPAPVKQSETRYQPIDLNPKPKAKPSFWDQLFSSKAPSSDTPVTQPPIMRQPSSTLANYVAQMSTQMLNSARYVNPTTPIGVASFVSLEHLNRTNPFGMQLAESFVFEMQQHGLSVIDYKATGFIRITPTGDFVYSRNTQELPKVQPIEYLLIGTYSRTMQGIMVNARIVGAKSKVVVASAQQLIPKAVYNNVMDIDPNSYKPKMQDGVLLIESP